MRHYIQFEWKKKISFVEECVCLECLGLPIQENQHSVELPLQSVRERADIRRLQFHRRNTQDYKCS